VELFQQLVERWGFPAAFAVWLMMSVTKDLRQLRAQVQKLVVVNAVILKTLDVPDPEKLAGPDEGT
jgi:hypothetical protein